MQRTQEHGENSVRDEPLSILIADDERALREVLSLHLKELDYQVYEARDGEEAVALAESLHPALILLDITMPKMNGWQVAQRLRRNPATAEIKLLMLSGIGTAVLGAGLPVLGGDAGLDKPFQLHELDAAISKLLTN